MQWHQINIAKRSIIRRGKIGFVWAVSLLWLSNCLYVLRKKIIRPFDKSSSWLEYLGLYYFLLRLWVKKIRLFILPSYIKQGEIKTNNICREHLSSFEISIIVTTYNLENYIGICLDSLIHQSAESIEIIVIDDCSSDKTYSILHDYQQRFSSFIKVYKNDTPKGNPSFGRNFGIQQASAPYVAFVDGDDWLRNDAIALSLRAISTYKPDIIFSEFKFFRDADNREIFSKTLSSQHNKINHSLCFDIHTGNDYFWNFMFNAACFKIFRTDFLRTQGITFPSLYLEDVGFSLQTYLAAKGIVRLPDELYFIRTQRRGVQTNRSALFSTKYGLDGLRNFELVNDCRKRVLPQDEDIKERLYYKFYLAIDRMILKYIQPQEMSLFLGEVKLFYQKIGIDEIKFCYFTKQEKMEVARLIGLSDEEYDMYLKMKSPHFRELWKFCSSLKAK